MLKSGSLDRVGLINAILSSPEFKSRLAGTTQYQENDPRGCLRSEAEAVFGSLPKAPGPRTPWICHKFSRRVDGREIRSRYPFALWYSRGISNTGNFHSDTLEWIGTLRSTQRIFDTVV